MGRRRCGRVPAGGGWPRSSFPTSNGAWSTLLHATARRGMPRNTLGGHATGAATGYLSLVVVGLTTAAPALATSVTGARVGAAALSLGLTSGLMVLARVPHPRQVRRR